MNAWAGELLSHASMGALSLSLSSSFLSTNSHCALLETSAANCKFKVMREEVLKRQSLRIRDHPAEERATPCSVGMRGSLLFDAESDLHMQPAADQVTELTGRSGRRVLTRRCLLASPLAAATLPVSPSLAAIKVENRAPYGNFLLRTFGIGDPDIYYPRFFQGTWICYSTLIAVETPQGEDKVDLKSVEQSRKRIGYTTTYQARFVPFEGYVVCDRLFTTVVRTKSQSIDSVVESIIGKNTIEHGTWDPRQPNHLELILKGGPKVEITVTKRSAGMFSQYEFESAEFSQQVLDNFSVKDGPPTVKASQNLTRYLWDDGADEVSKIEAIQKVSMYAVPKGGKDFEGMEIFNSTMPVAIYKYRITFERQGL